MRIDYKHVHYKTRRRLLPLPQVVFITSLSIFIFSIIWLKINSKPYAHQEPPIVNIETNIETPAPIEEAVVQEIEWQSITVEPRQNLSLIFQELDLSKRTLANILAMGADAQPLTKLRPKQKIDFQVDDHNQLVQMRLHLTGQTSITYLCEEGKWQAKKETVTLQKRIRFVTGTINDSLTAAGEKAGASEKLMLQLAAIFAWDIDFSKDLREGDQFTIVHEELFDGNKRVSTGNILAAKFINQRKPYHAIRYLDPDGHTDFYNLNGQSLRKAFLRKPLKYKRISSHFSSARKHPVLHTIRAHKGVDFAAPKGTPIKSAANGRIIYLGRKGGYGKVIIIQHGKIYSTLYAHLSRYAKELRSGSKVKKGQVIGYVGKTGLATAPHLHYEFRIRNKPQNPVKVKLPQAAPIKPKFFDDFEDHASSMVSQMTQFAEKQGKTELA